MLGNLLVTVHKIPGDEYAFSYAAMKWKIQGRTSS